MNEEQKEKYESLVLAIMHVIGQEVEIDGVATVKIDPDLTPIIKAQIVCLAATISGHTGTLDSGPRRAFHLSIVEDLKENLERFANDPACGRIPVQ